MGFEDFEATAARLEAAERALTDRGEAQRYLAALGLELVAVIALVAGGINNLVWLTVVGILVLGSCSWYFNYLAQRARDRVERGDYLIGLRIQWQAAGYSLGGLVPRARQLLREAR